MLKKLFEVSGTIELLTKEIAYSGKLSTDKLKNVYHKIFLHKGEKIEVDKSLINKVFKYIDSLGIKKGDILIVHSSMEGMRKVDPQPEAIIDYLLELVGSEGTLVFPAFPIINLKYDDTKIQTYNPKRTLCWTGMLPNTFLKYPGVIRSEFPFNTLAALGPHAKAMMRDNLSSDVPHGKNSSWAYCVEHHAKILYLGISIAECNTVLHMADDFLSDEWPINNWYEKQKYNIKTEEGIIEKTIKVCSSFWVKYNVCYNFNARLKRLGYLSETDVDGIIVGFCQDSKSMMDYVIEQARKGKIRYKIPRKYWKG